MAEVKRTNPDFAKVLMQRLQELGGYEGKVGWFSDAKYEDGTSAAYVASIQEYGHGAIPPRLGMRETNEKLRVSFPQKALQQAKNIIKGKMTGHDAMEQMTQYAEGEFLKRITSNPGPRLKPLTLALRYKKDQGIKITGSIVNQTRQELWDEFFGGKAVKLSSRTKTLNDTGYLISTMTSVVTSV